MRATVSITAEYLTLVLEPRPGQMKLSLPDWDWGRLSADVAKKIRYRFVAFGVGEVELSDDEFAAAMDAVRGSQRSAAIRSRQKAWRPGGLR